MLLTVVIDFSDFKLNYLAKIFESAFKQNISFTHMKKCIQFNEKENYGKYIDILDDLRQFSQNDMIRIIVALSLMCCKTYITTLMTL